MPGGDDRRAGASPPPRRSRGRRPRRCRRWRRAPRPAATGSGGSCGAPRTWRGRRTRSRTLPPSGDAHLVRRERSVGRPRSDPGGDQCPKPSSSLPPARRSAVRTRARSSSAVPTTSRADHRRGAREGAAARSRATVEDVIWGCGQPAGEAGTNVARVAALARRRRRARRHGEPLLLVVVADDPHGGARDPGRRGRRVHLRRRRDGEPVHERHGRRRPAEREVRRGRASARSCAARAASRRGRRRPGLPDVYIAMGQTAENVVEAEGVTPRGDGRVRARVRSSSRSQSQENGFFEREITPVTLARRHGRVEGRRPARRHDRREARDAEARVPPRRQGDRGQRVPARTTARPR